MADPDWTTSDNQADAFFKRVTTLGHHALNFVLWASHCGLNEIDLCFYRLHFWNRVFHIPCTVSFAFAAGFARAVRFFHFQVPVKWSRTFPARPFFCPNSSAHFKRMNHATDQALRSTRKVHAIWNRAAENVARSMPPLFCRKTIVLKVLFPGILLIEFAYWFLSEAGGERCEEIQQSFILWLL